MSITDNKALVEKAIGILSGETPEDFAEEAFAADYRDHNAPGDGGPARFLKVRAQLQTAFPGLKHEILAMVAEDDVVTIHMQVS
jgi:predicted SnoaL-like aldol condensation-catalyzing enzyme